MRGRGRAVLGFDTDRGAEGVYLAVIDSGRMGIHANGRDFYGCLGTAPAADSVGNIGAPFSGLFLEAGKASRTITP